MKSTENLISANQLPCLLQPGNRKQCVQSASHRWASRFTIRSEEVMPNKETYKNTCQENTAESWLSNQASIPNRRFGTGCHDYGGKSEELPLSTNDSKIDSQAMGRKQG